MGALAGCGMTTATPPPGGLAEWLRRAAATRITRVRSPVPPRKEEECSSHHKHHGVAGENHLIYIFAFIVACCLLLLTWFSAGLREVWKFFPGGTVTAVISMLGVIGISAYLLH